MKGIRTAIVLRGVTAMTLCVLSVMTLCAPPSFAAKDSKKDVEAALSAKKAAQAAAAKQAKQIDAQVDDAKSKLVDTARRLSEMETQLSVTDKTLKDLQADEADTLKKLNREHDALGGLLAAASKYNRTSTPELLLRADPLDAARAALVMKSLIPELHGHADALKQQIAAMGIIEKEITAHREAQAAQLKTFASQKEELAGLLQERQSAYRKTEDERRQYEKDVAALAKEAKSLADLEKKIQEQAAKERARELAKERAGKRDIARAPDRTPLPSSMVQPVSGSVVTGFGQNDELGAKSEGITYDARAGAVVVTPLAGKVKFAGPFQKYKQILIIEHRGGYHSLIAGLGRIDTVVGASLAAGEPVGAVGSGAQDTKIYYELRHSGDPVNPRNIKIAQRKQDKS